MALQSRRRQVFFGMGDRRPWPLFDLRVETPRLVLRYADDGDLQTLAAFRSDVVLQPGEEPFDGDSSFGPDPV